jgi:predicted RNase H-like HicB family nuclease
MAVAEYELLEDGVYVGQIRLCPGVLAFGDSLSECEGELRSTLEEWMVLGLKLGHTLPVIGGIDLNEVPRVEPLEAV